MDKLWEFFNEKPSEKMPSEFLQEVATQLKVDTGGLFDSFITETTSDSSPEIVFAFYLIAPRLKNYSYRLFQFEFNSLINPYPIKCMQFAKDIKNNQHFICNTYDEFTSQLTHHITNVITRGIITSIKTHIEIVEQYNRL